jgi:hypothetical protein
MRPYLEKTIHRKRAGGVISNPSTATKQNKKK